MASLQTLFRCASQTTALLLLGFTCQSHFRAQPLEDNHMQGSTHEFLLLKSSEGKPIAVGDMVQVAHGPLVHSHLVFHFRDGSIDDETTVYRQGRVFQLLRDRHIQRGPSFPKPLDLTVNVAASEAVSRELKDGKEEIKKEHLDPPGDLANGMVLLVLQSIPSGAAGTSVSYLTGTPKPRVVKLLIKPDGKQDFVVAGSHRHAQKYNIHVELGGITGMVAPLIGKQPSDIQVWVADGEVPTVLRSEGALYEGGPIWTIEQATPSWPVR